MNCKTNKNTCTEFSELEVVFKIYNYCKSICLPTYSFVQFVFTNGFLSISLNRDVFSFNRHSEYCRLQNLKKAVNYI